MTLTALILAGMLAGVPSPKPATEGAALHYPEAHKTDTVYDYAGTKVADPYSWLETVDSPDTQEWIQQEHDLTANYLNAIPGRDRIAARLKKIFNYERFTSPEK